MKNKVFKSGCAMAMTVISANATACWVNGQDTPPENLKKYRKF